ncbi:uncharacterized protein BT62DRAFT_962968 [Guyanagaster necrorhizus]|uniref:DUF218 domain-containing protein n=1 Tax=Guyanagaster necrorhizus TaxID=856835 RepID=A0A9P7VZV2_9AGAR|nr:uncharacterized protein BT62DRAFT_962968 [Guyanagaster necrorhizus MCA 3950]KAG7449592.1 hypothetical protein BT62DRAFT_962968 [Guyanagaster necrorhizus MCA 3950]
MLPTPVSFSRRPFRRNGGSLNKPRRRIFDSLLTRARVTNLAVLLLATFSAISFLVNISLYFSASSSPDSFFPHSIISTIVRHRALANLNHLVIVPGHAIWKGADSTSRLDMDDWVLEPYQREGNRIETFYRHIARGAEITLKDDHALVVFSGGQTRTSSTTTEAESYLRLALNSNVFGGSSHPYPRATTENYALDSFQNLLFSIARFHEYSGHYPDQITVVGYEMKRACFTDLHRIAVRWPKEKFHYIGIDPKAEDASALARQGEQQNGYLPYSKDLYGCHSELLEKRKSRNPFSRFHSYLTSSPELRELFEYCPSQSTTVFHGKLPWD